MRDIIFMILLHNVVSENLTDLQLCRVTHVGAEYQGNVFRTMGGLRCQFWAEPSPLPRPVAVKDSDMPEGSLRAARNFCRNPGSSSEEGPWCYTSDADLFMDECDVPLCLFTACRVTGPGAEYAGPVTRATHGGECVSWGKARAPATGKRYPHASFPGDSRAGARSECRNPDGRAAGPWCVARHPEDGSRRPALCDVPFCDPRECSVVTVAEGEGLGGSSGAWPIHSLFTAVRRVPGPLDVPTEVPPVQGSRRFSPAPAADAGGAGASGASDREGMVGSDFRSSDDVEDVFQQWLAVNGPLLERFRPPEAELERLRRSGQRSGGGILQATEEVPRRYSMNSSTDIKKNKESEEEVGAPPVLALPEAAAGVEAAGARADGGAEAPEWRMQFSVRLWDAAAWPRAEARLLLSTFGAPATDAREHARWGAGVEIRLSNNRSAFVAGPLRSNESVATPGLLSGLRWTPLWVRLGGRRAMLGRGGEATPLLDAELTPPDDSALALDAGRPRFLSVWGPGVRWDLPSCAAECEVHWSSRLHFVRFWRLRAAPGAGTRASFSLRAQRSAYIEMRMSPAQPFPNIWVVLSERGTSLMSLQTNASQEREVLLNLKTPGLLNFWEWRSFTLSVFANEVQVLWVREGSAELLMSARHEMAREMRWFSVAADDALALWTIFCEPSAADAPPPALPPDCSTTRAALGYAGEQAVSLSGRPCLPWVVAPLPPDFAAATLPGAARVRARNYCRNLDGSRRGPFCYTLAQRPPSSMAGSGGDGGGPVILREPCQLRSCQSTDCHVAGTANDYMGETSLTRTGRKCLSWTSVKALGKVPAQHVNESFFPDDNLKMAGAACRNPSRSVAGPWCYTKDPRAPVDLCPVHDCEKTEECTVVVRVVGAGAGAGSGQRMFLRPEWRQQGMAFALKLWDPERPTGIVVSVHSRAAPATADALRLVMGADDDQHVELLKGQAVLKRITLPRLVPAGRWAEYWLLAAPGKVQLGLRGMPYPVFEWEATDPSHSFVPVYVAFRALPQNSSGGSVGIAFPCTECHIEESHSQAMDTFYPIGLWYKYSGHLWDNMTLHLRGNGSALLSMLLMPESETYFIVKFEKFRNQLIFQKRVFKQLYTLKIENLPYSPIQDNKWTKVFLKWRENRLAVKIDMLSVIDMRSEKEALLFYFFAVTTERGPVAWTVNCRTQEIGGAAVDGAWSEWGPVRCSTPCGGGRGVRVRHCNNPKPNIFGHPCPGSRRLEVRCNEFRCGDLSPETLQLLRFRLRTQGHSLLTAEGAAVRVRCDGEAVLRARLQAPSARVEWLHAGVLLPQTATAAMPRVRVTQEAVVISRALPSDSGVYLCVLRGGGVGWGGGAHAGVVRVLTLAVQPRAPSQRVAAVVAPPWPQLRCRGATLGMVFAQLSVRWLHDGAVFKDYGITTPAAVEFIPLDNITTKFTGFWTCEVREEDLNFTWVTNWIWLDVRRTPNIFTHLMEDELTAPFFRWMKYEWLVATSLIIIIVLTIVAVFGGAYVYNRMVVSSAKSTSFLSETEEK